MNDTVFVIQGPDNRYLKDVDWCGNHYERLYTSRLWYALCFLSHNEALEATDDDERVIETVPPLPDNPEYWVEPDK